MERRTFLRVVGAGALTSGVIRLDEARSAESVWKRRDQFGMNLTGIADWITELPFADLYRTARPWKKTDAELAAIRKDAHGNHLLKPGEFVEYFMLTISGGRYPTGVYTCTYDGKGKVELNRHNVKRVVSERPGRIEAEVEPKDGAPLVLTLRETDPADPVRNLHVYLPGLEAAKSPWNPPFTEGIKPFGTLRFMDWQSTNGSPVKTWAGRSKPDDARYSTPAGVPPELMIQLANDTGSDPWFCMPHLADDDFIRRFAGMVKQRLNPARKAEPPSPDVRLVPSAFTELVHPRRRPLRRLQQRVAAEQMGLVGSEGVSGAAPERDAEVPCAGRCHSRLIPHSLLSLPLVRPLSSVRNSGAPRPI